MRSLSTNQEQEETEKEWLIPNNCKVVEYFHPIMSKELLYKFPDNSAFDFDYSQSSIWSPLVPRLYSPLDLYVGSDPITPRALQFDECKKRKGVKQKGVAPPIFKKNKKRKVEFNFDLSATKMKQHKKNIHDFSPSPPVKVTCPSFKNKGWNKVLKAASKHFKKKDPMAHVKLFNYLRGHAIQ